MSETPYPEHDKLHAMKDRQEAAQAMLDYLLVDSGYTLCKWQDSRKTATGEMIEDAWSGKMMPEYIYDPEGYYPVHVSKENLMAGCLNIDPDKLEAEKRQMIDDIRAANAARVASNGNG